MSIAYRIASWWLGDKQAKSQVIVRENDRKDDARLSELLDRLEEQEQQIREHAVYRDALLKALPDIVFVMDKDGYYLDCYANDESRLVYPCSVVVGKHLSDCLKPKVVEKCLDIFGEVLETQNTGYIEYELLIDGEEKIFEARIVRLDDERLLSTVREITKWKHAQYALAKQLTAQQEALWKCERAKDCPGNPSGVCRKTEIIGLDEAQQVGGQ